MKNWYLLLFIFLITGCNEDEKEQDYNEIKIEKHYPYFSETKALDGVDKNTLELFNYNVFSINSITQLNENPLFSYYPEDLKEELSKCNFEQSTLIITSFFSKYEVIGVDPSFGYITSLSEFLYRQDVSCKSSLIFPESICLTMDAISVKKIPDDSKLACGRGIILIDTK